MARPRSLGVLFLCSIFLLLVPSGLSSQSASKRAALVIGNGAYASSPLVNPPNDAADMAALFKAADMDVISRTNLDLAGMEKAVADFVKLLKGKESAVVYYAGHGVQVNGENYLIPVKETINSDTQARSRALSVSDLLGHLKGAGARTVILFLDACRDNPFPGSSRSGSRGLSVVAAPSEVETLVAFATEPEKTAADGKGRNGVFTAALLKNLAEPGVNITEAMIKVRADVLAATGGAQAPAVDMRLARPWYLVDPETAARKASEASLAANAELAGLERELAERQARIASAKDAAAREVLELEQRKQEALRSAKQLEADSLTRTARFRAQAAEAEQVKQAQVQASIRAQETLAAAMAKRRAELEKLGAQDGGDDPDALVAAVERLRGAVAEIKGQFEQSRQEAERGILAGFEPLFAVFAKAEPELWETDAEFAQRVQADKAKLEADRKATLAARQTALAAEESRQTAGLQAQLDKALTTLESKTWMVPATQVRVEPGAYDRNTRLWPVKVTSLDPLVEAEENFVIDFAKSADLKTELVAFDRAVKANALVGEIGWGIRGDLSKGRYILVLRSVVLRNLETGTPVASSSPRKDLAYFSSGNRSSAVSLVKVFVDFSVPSGEKPATVYVDGLALGTTPLTTKVAVKQAEVRYLWLDGAEWKETQTWTAGTRYTVRPNKPIRDEIYVQGGSFPMGSTDGDSDEKPVHTVTVSDFWMMKTEVTQKDYQALMGTNPSYFKGDTLPVEQVSWYDAVAYANKLSQKDGLTPAYTINGTTVTVNRGASGWRLPTEAEWEYAARGGTKSRGYTYAGGNDTASVAWYGGNSGHTTKPVGTKTANELGFHDLSGNVWEWCWDWYGNYASGTQNDPTGAASGSSRVFRGGSWGDGASRTRSAERDGGTPGNRGSDIGFRLLRPLVRGN